MSCAYGWGFAAVPPVCETDVRGSPPRRATDGLVAKFYVSDPALRPLNKPGENSIQKRLGAPGRVQANGPGPPRFRGRSEVMVVDNNTVRYAEPEEQRVV